MKKTIIAFIIIIAIGTASYFFYHRSNSIPDNEEISNLTQARMVVVEKTTADDETKIVFLDSEKNEITEIKGNNLSFTLEKFYQQFYGDPLIDMTSSKIALNKAIEYPSGIFYFFVTDPVFCGMGGCKWFLFRYDNINQEILNIRNDIGGSIREYHLSPNGKNLAIGSSWSAGAGRHTDFIDIFYLEELESKNVDLSDLFQRGENFSFLFADFLDWINDDCFNICGFGGFYKYCLSTSEFELVSKNILEYGCPATACLAKGTEITMADESYKNIENIEEGDIIKTFDFEIKGFKLSKVIKIIERKDPIIEINDMLKAAPDEPIYLLDGTIKTAEEIMVGEFIFNENKNGIEVRSVRYSADKIDTYDLILEDSDNFFANGYLVHTPMF